MPSKDNDAITRRRLAIFDLDNTLLAGDSDDLWGEYLCENNFIAPEHRASYKSFYEDYKRGELDIQAYLEFQLATLTMWSPARLDSKRRRWLYYKILPLVLPDAVQLLHSHRIQGHELMIITSTNSFLTAPIARYLGVDNLIATDPERIGERYTGRVAGEPAFAEGKLRRLRQWLQQQGLPFPEQSWFYSDSHNDLPLLRAVTHPVAVNPDDVLRSKARDNNWPVISLGNSAAAQGQS